jgi:hypothetical protein
MENSNAAKIAEIANDVSWIKKDISEIKETLKAVMEGYVTRGEFNPVKTIVYTFAGIILTSFVVGLIAYATAVLKIRV